MAGVEDQLYELINQINRLMRVWGGGGNSPFTNPGTSGTRPQSNSNANLHASTGTFSTSLRKLSTLITGMHGGVEDFTHSLGRVAEGFIGLELAVGAFKSILNTAKTYSKMTDIGQNFNGSMFTMMQQVGKAGLSVDQFSAMMSRNSVASSALGDYFDDTSGAASQFAKSLNQTSATTSRTTKQTMGDLQLAVRNNLQGFGFYGMALDEITNTTSDYAETLTESGSLFKYTDKERTKSVVDLIGEASSLALAFGKNREEIIKSTNEIMRQTNLAARLSISTEDQVNASQQMITMFAGQSKSLAAMAGEQLGKGGYVKTQLGNALIGSGMGNVNSIVQESLNDARSGVVPTADVAASRMIRTVTAFNGQINRLENMDSAEANEALNLHQELAASLSQYQQKDAAGRGVTDGRGNAVYDQTKLAKALAEAKKDAEVHDALTKDAVLFESEFRKVTGGFLEGFYGAIASVMGGEGSDRFEIVMSGLHDLFKALGTVLGGVIGAIVDITGYFGFLITTLKEVNSGFNYVISSIKRMFGFGEKDKDGKDITSSGLTSGLITAGLTVAMGVFATRFISRFFGLGGGKGSALGAVAGAGARTLGKVPGLGWLGKLGGAAAGFGGEGCCDTLSKGIGDLTDRVDFHGDRAHANASKGIGGAVQDAEHAVARRSGGFLSKIPGLRSLFRGVAGAAALEGAEVLAGAAPKVAETVTGAAPKVAETVTETAPKAAGSLLSRIPVLGKLFGGGAAAASAVAAPKVAETVAGAAAEATAKTGASVFGKIAMKSIVPGIGLAFAAQRTAEGDYLGAGLETMSSVATAFPEIGGNIVAGIIQAGLFARDAIGKDKTDSAVSGWFGSSSTTTPSTDAYLTDHGTAAVDSTGSVTDAPLTDQEKVDSTKTQLNQLDAMKAQLDAKLAEDRRTNNIPAVNQDSNSLAVLLKQIRDLTAQQNRLQKDGDQKMAAAIQDQQLYNPIYAQ